VTRRDPKTGHQTPVLTTWPPERTASEVASSMFHRWREENLFRFMRPRGLDAMDSDAKVDDDYERLVSTLTKPRRRERSPRRGRASLGQRRSRVGSRSEEATPAREGSVPPTSRPSLLLAPINPQRENWR